MQGARLTRRQESTPRGNRPSSGDGRQKEATRIRGEKGEATESAILTGTQESNEIEFSSSSSIVYSDSQEEEKPIEIDGGNAIQSVAFLADGELIVSGSTSGRIQRWKVKNGRALGTTMRAWSAIWNIAVSRDGKWLVGGTSSGQVTVWDAEIDEEVIKFKGHCDNSPVYAVDISSDATTIATGSCDKTAYVWSLSTGKRLLGPFEHRNRVIAVKFSPDGRLFATATFRRKSVRIYDSQDGHLLVDFPIQVSSSLSNQSLAWVSDSKQLFVLSRDGNIHCLDVSSRTTLSRWPTHSNKSPRCISLAANGTFIAASAHSSISFWDTATHTQIGSVIHHPARVESMAISANYDLVSGGGTKIILQNLHDILPSFYFDDVSVPASKVRCLRCFIHHKPLIDYNRNSKSGPWELKHFSKRQLSPFVHSMSIQVCLSPPILRLSNIHVHQTGK